ncbi:MAG: hypothetical protein U7123_06070 [Potamolinea sp.]
MAIFYSNFTADALIFAKFCELVGELRAIAFRMRSALSVRFARSPKIAVGEKHSED